MNYDPVLIDEDNQNNDFLVKIHQFRKPIEYKIKPIYYINWGTASILDKVECFVLLCIQKIVILRINSMEIISERN